MSRREAIKLVASTYMAAKFMAAMLNIPTTIRFYRNFRQA
jgi:hypothetical protein